MTKSIPVKKGFLYRGETKVVTLGKDEEKKVKLVNEETYIILKIYPNAHITMTLKKPGASMTFDITNEQYGQYIIPGRKTFHDVDPYADQ